MSSLAEKISSLLALNISLDEAQKLANDELNREHDERERERDRERERERDEHERYMTTRQIQHVEHMASIGYSVCMTNSFKFKKKSSILYILH